jgi:hypothetical protein
MSWQNSATWVLLLVLLYAATAPISCTEIICEALPQPWAASQSGNVTTIPTVYGFPTGPAYQVKVTVERIPGVGLSFEGEGAIIDPQAGTSEFMIFFLFAVICNLFWLTLDESLLFALTGCGIY